LGTCKHIEALLLRLRKRYGAALESKAMRARRSSISLQYGETIEIRLALAGCSVAGSARHGREYFDSAGLLRREHFRSFHRVLEVLSQAPISMR
jgi:hypothetical protein